MSAGLSIVLSYWNTINTRMWLTFVTLFCSLWCLPEASFLSLCSWQEICLPFDYHNKINNLENTPVIIMYVCLCACVWMQCLWAWGDMLSIMCRWVSEDNFWVFALSIYHAEEGSSFLPFSEFQTNFSVSF